MFHLALSILFVPLHIVLHHLASFHIILCCFVAFYPLPFVSRLVLGMFGSRLFLGRCLADEDVASVTSTEMTENLVRAEVRRQLAERCGREALTGRIVLPPQSLPKMTDNESRTSVDVLPGRVLRNLPKSALFHLYSSLQVAQVLCARVIFGDCRTFAGALMLQLMMLWL